jgi:AraC-like DNA-binding protein
MDETANGLFDSEILFGRWTRDVREMLRNLQAVGKKVDFIQEQLVTLLHKGRRDNSVIEFCVGVLRSSAGRIAIGELERKTGYSRRYLNLLFKRHVGLAPKVLAGIFRFQTFYRKWAQGVPYDALKADLYDYYYDQSHFIREFQKMTGYSPRRFTLEVSNEFGRRLSLK